MKHENEVQFLPYAEDEENNPTFKDPAEDYIILKDEAELTKTTVPAIDQINFSVLAFITIFFFVGIMSFLYLIRYSESKKQFTVVARSEDIFKPLTDERSYKSIKLANGLEALIISDPNASKSGASMAVNVGSFKDDVLGLAHFCEHMLFMGSESFPDPAELEDLLKANDGYNNAFTQSEKTVFFFEIGNSGFRKAFRIFSKMFFEPTFEMKWMNKEISAVNSEFEKDLNADLYRKYEVIKSLANPDHPFSRFSIGNYKTLRDDVKPEVLNTKLKEYFKNYFKPEAMKLVVVCYFLKSQGTAVEYAVHY